MDDIDAIINYKRAVQPVDDIDAIINYQPKPNVPAAPVAPPVEMTAWDKLARQAGLFGRSAVHAVTGIPEVVGNGLNSAVNLGISGYNNLTGSHVAPLPMVSTIVDSAADQAHLPRPETTQERVVSDLTSAAGGINMVRPISTAISKIPEIADYARLLRAHPGAQAVAATGAAGGAAAARETGIGEDVWGMNLNPLAQILMGGAGAVAGGFGSGVAGSVAKAPVRWVPKVLPDVAEYVAPGSVRANSPNAAVNGVSQATADMPASLRPTEDASVFPKTEGVLKQYPGMIPSAATRYADFLSLGMQGENAPTLGQLSRNPSQWSEEYNLKSDPRLATRFNSQQQFLARVLANTVGSPTEAHTAGDTVGTALRNIDEGMRTKVSDAYRAVRESGKAGAEVDMKGLAQDYAKIKEDFADQIPQGVRSRFESYGLMDGKQTKTFTYKDAENLLQLINEHSGGLSTGGTKTALDKLRSAVKTSITQAGTEGDPFSEARALAAQRFALHDSVPALDDVVSGRYGKFGDNTWSPERIVRDHITGGTDAGFRNLADLLKANKYSEAYDTLRSQVGNPLLKSGFGFNPNGDNTGAAARYAEALTRLGSARLSAVYDPTEIDTLKTVGRTLSHTVTPPAGHTANFSHSGIVTTAALERIPFIGKHLSTSQKVALALKADKEHPSLYNSLVYNDQDLPIPPLTPIKPVNK